MPAPIITSPSFTLPNMTQSANKAHAPPCRGYSSVSSLFWHHTVNHRFDASKGVQSKTGLRSELGAQWSLHDERMGRCRSAKAHVDSKMQLVMIGSFDILSHWSQKETMAKKLLQYLEVLKNPPQAPSFDPEIDDIDAEQDRKIR